MIEITTLLYEALVQCYNHLDVYRDIEAYCTSRVKITGGNGNRRYTPNRSEVPGNLAVCALIDSSRMEIISNTLISPSFSISAEVREHQREQCLAGRPLACRIASKIHGGGWEDGDEFYDTRKIFVTHGENLEECQIIEETIPCQNLDRSSDSEHVLINVIDVGLANSYLPKDLLCIIATERVPCASCTQAMIEFLVRNEAAKLFVAYTFDTNRSSDSEARHANEFITQVRSSSVFARMQLERIFVNGKILESFPTSLRIEPARLA